uniref:Uncharacterized protein n=1 Tax=Rhizophora mucronata TaxID=61149 RepID=A0A2P2KPQ2_RHIMU
MSEVPETGLFLTDDPYSLNYMPYQCFCHWPGLEHLQEFKCIPKYMICTYHGHLILLSSEYFLETMINLREQRTWSDICVAKRD